MPPRGWRAGTTPATRGRRRTWSWIAWRRSPGWRRRPRWSCIPGRPAPMHRDQPTYALIDIDPGAEHHLGGGAGAGAAVSHRAGAPGAHRPAEGDRQAGDPGLDPRPRRLHLRRDARAGWSSCRAPSAALVPDLVSWEWTKRDRKGRARLDFTQNAVNKTLVAPYSVRPAPGAPGIGADPLGGARGRGAAAGPLDRRHRAARGWQRGGRPVRRRPRAGAGAATALEPTRISDGTCGSTAPCIRQGPGGASVSVMRRQALEGPAAAGACVAHVCFSRFVPPVLDRRRMSPHRLRSGGRRAITHRYRAVGRGGVLSVVRSSQVMLASRCTLRPCHERRRSRARRSRTPPSRGRSAAGSGRRAIAPGSPSSSSPASGTPRPT